MKAKSLQDLKQLRARLAEAEARAAQAAAERTRAQHKAQAEQALFARAIGPTQPLRPHGRVVHAPPPVAPEPMTRAWFATTSVAVRARRMECSTKHCLYRGQAERMHSPRRSASG